jgi:hypothetical protein
MDEKEPEKKKDGWERAGFLLHSSSGLITAITVAIIGLIGSNYLKNRELADTASRERMQIAETNVRVYTELMSRREEAESALRKDMFISIIQSFLRPASASLDEKVLNIELLSYNFHESLNLKPLFVYLEREILVSNHPEKNQYLDRLHKVAREITRKQMPVLESAGAKFDRVVDMESFKKSPGGITLDGSTLKADGIERSFDIVVLETDLKTKEIRVRLDIRRQTDSTKIETNSAEFWVGFYDFPMIDNTRLSNDQRCAVVLNAFDPESADITLVYFPGSYASLNEKPYYQEVVQSLMRTNVQMSNTKSK